MKTMPYNPKFHDLSDAALQQFVGGELAFLLSAAVSGFAPKRYCGHVVAIAHEGTALRFKFSWIAECVDASAHDAEWMGVRCPEGAWYEIDLAVWDAVKEKEEGCPEFLHGATGSTATLRPPTSEKLHRAESVNF
ncbi:MAG: hypothetical protein HYT82_02710 [Candidatus Harrisonbacteria bacterium]|nr:hypothetical protein [Candidatus Harrisonbacteria bacterium]